MLDAREDGIRACAEVSPRSSPDVTSPVSGDASGAGPGHMPRFRGQVAMCATWVQAGRSSVV